VGCREDRGTLGKELKETVNPNAKSLEAVLWDAAFDMSAPREQMDTWSLKQWLSKYSWLLGPLLVLVGGLGIWKCPHDLGQRFSDALFISGVLSLTVDFYLKRKLQEDAARDIFQHLMGINLPPEMRTKLQLFITENSIYRKNVTISVHVSARDDGRVSVKFIIDGTVAAASDAAYTQLFQAEKNLNPVIECVSLRSESESLYSLDRPIIVDQPNEPLILQWEGETQKLSQGEELIQHFEYTIERASTDFYHIFFGNAVIHPVVRVTADPDIAIFAGKPDIKNGNEYVYKKVFLQGDHITIRWCPIADVRPPLTYQAGSLNSN
jgi:hypothetical protein